MFRALNTAATGMVAQQTNVDVIANNLANVNTTGFRRSRAEFKDLIYQNVRYPGGNVADGQRLPTGYQVGEGTRIVATNQLHVQGSMIENGGDFVVPMTAVQEVHDEKVVLDGRKIDKALAEAIRKAHIAEDPRIP